MPPKQGQQPSPRPGEPGGGGGRTATPSRSALRLALAARGAAQFAAEGLSNREIGERLFLSHRTVGGHLYRIFPKLDITGRAQLRDALTRVT